MASGYAKAGYYSIEKLLSQIQQVHWIQPLLKQGRQQQHPHPCPANRRGTKRKEMLEKLPQSGDKPLREILSILSEEANAGETWQLWETRMKRERADTHHNDDVNL